MAISTLDGALAGMQPPRSFAKAVSATLVAGRPASLYALGGNPGAGTFNTTLAGGTYSSSSSIPAGIIPHVDPGSGNSYLARFSANASQAGTLLLCDRLWDNGGITITSTTAQTVSSVTWPARDTAGATSGNGVLVAVEVSAATGTGTPTLTLGYTNQAGTASRSATNIDATVASSAIGAFHRIGLQAGDTGVQSIQTFTLSATWTSGTINLVAYRVLATLELAGAYIPAAVDALTSGFPRLYNGVCPFLVFLPNTTTAVNVSGTYVETQG